MQKEASALQHPSGTGHQLGTVGGNRQGSAQDGGGVYDLVPEKALLSKEQLNDILRPENMTDPREIPKR